MEKNKRSMVDIIGRNESSEWMESWCSRVRLQTEVFDEAPRVKFLGVVPLEFCAKIRDHGDHG